MNKHKRAPLSQQGAVSFITVLFVTVILTVLVIGFIRVMISEQRQSTDDDLSNRAYYAAESGIEDAKSRLAAYLADPGYVPGSVPAAFDECDPAPEPLIEGTPTTTLATEITCQTIKINTDDFLADAVEPWHSVAIPLRSSSEFNNFKVEWHRPEVDGLSYGLRGNNSLPRTGSWGTPLAGMKATLITRNQSGSTTREDIVQATRIVHMLPRPSGASSFNIGSFGFGNSSPQAVRCNPSGGDPASYACSAQFNGLTPANNDYILLLTPLYRATSLRVALYDGATNVTFIEAQAEIDVTARAGDIFRRVRARVSLVDPAYSLLPDLAVGANEICKDYRLRSDKGEFLEANPGIVNFCNHNP